MAHSSISRHGKRCGTSQNLGPAARLPKACPSPTEAHCKNNGPRRTKFIKT